jgi:hypothetical protein
MTMTPTIINHRLHTGLTMKILFWIVCGLTLLAFQSPTFAAGGTRRIVNLSTRANVGTGPNVLIAGIIVQGYGNATLVFRGIGPSLSPYFPAGTVLADPSLELFNSSGVVIWSNNNWQDSQAAEISATGLAPSNGYESAIKMSLPPGAYTAVLTGLGGGTGIGVIEVYDITPSNNSIRLMNISSRAHSENFYGKQTIGMILQGNGNKSLLIRGLGPSLPLADTLPNPFIGIYNSAGTILNWNESWKTKSDGTSQQAQITATGIPPTNDLEAATIASLGPEAFTVTMQDNSGTTGIAVIDMYDLEPPPPPPPPPPTPTPTPVPTHLVLWDDYGGGAYVGYNSSGHPLDPTGEVKTSPLLYGGPGPITVHYTGYSWYWFCTPCAPASQLYPELLDQNGNVVQRGGGIGFSQASVYVSGMTTFSWNGGNFKIRMMARSSHSFPNPDYVALTHYDVYAPF